MGKVKDQNFDMSLMCPMFIRQQLVDIVDKLKILEQTEIDIPQKISNIKAIL